MGDFAHALCNHAQMDWDDLRHVLAIARERTLSGAATALGVSHTTVGRRVRAIEETLGVRLFDNTPDGFIPTPAGQDVAEVAERMEAELLAVEARVLGRDAQLKGQLRVATMDIFFRRFHPAFSSFMTRYPGIALTLMCSDRELSLTRREADVALRMTDSPPEHLVGRKVGRVKFAVYASRALVASVGQGASYQDYPWLHWDERLQMVWLDRWLAQRAPNASIAMRVDVSSLVLRQAIAAGIGVHFLACFDGDADPELQRVGPIEDEFGRDVWLLTLPELRHTQRVRAFIDHMSDALAEHRDALAGSPREEKVARPGRRARPAKR
jgi:DNA-binding transcriptional LysR family regulator